MTHARAWLWDTSALSLFSAFLSGPFHDCFLPGKMESRELLPSLKGESERTAVWVCEHMIEFVWNKWRSSWMDELHVSHGETVIVLLWGTPLCFDDVGMAAQTTNMQCCHFSTSSWTHCCRLCVDVCSCQRMHKTQRDRGRKTWRAGKEKKRTTWWIRKAHPIPQALCFGLPGLRLSLAGVTARCYPLTSGTNVCCSHSVHQHTPTTQLFVFCCVFASW